MLVVVDGQSFPAPTSPTLPADAAAPRLGTSTTQGNHVVKNRQPSSTPPPPAPPPSWAHDPLWLSTRRVETSSLPMSSHSHCFPPRHQTPTRHDGTRTTYEPVHPGIRSLLLFLEARKTPVGRVDVETFFQQERPSTIFVRRSRNSTLRSNTLSTSPVPFVYLVIFSDRGFRLPRCRNGGTRCDREGRAVDGPLHVYVPIVITVQWF